MARLDYAALNSTDPLHDVVGVPGCEPGRLGDDRTCGRVEVAEFVDAAGAARASSSAGSTTWPGCGPTPTCMIWWHAESIEALQGAYPTGCARTALGRARVPGVVARSALHRPAEFNKSHVPAFLAGEEARRYLCVYPFVRSYDWYLLPDAERRQMLAEHGKMARGYPDVRANTVSSFALGDYEWMLAFEADELHRIVDLMRDLRGHRGPSARPRGDPVLHRAAGAGRRPGHRDPAVNRPSALASAPAAVEMLVDAVPQVRRRRVALALEHVAEVAVAVRAQRTSTRRMPSDESTRSMTASPASGVKNDGHPQCDSNFASLRNSSAPQARQA